MHALELKIPPPVVALTFAAAMWVLSQCTLSFEIESLARVGLSTTLAVVGAGFSLSGVVTFRRAKTTANPMKPQNASRLVTTGIFGITRNPMYVGLSLVLTGLAIFLSAPCTLVGPLAFILYIDRFQITPEERVLLKVFGEPYGVYIAKVKRWL